ncbi:HEAT repeat domain-containing protein [Amycolatopsis sp. NPDC051102]|uniref:nSTAND1 domain-containing NTPase n=1 Tax=Amycolatopsis sp. NPDC051102 TaxID=3155163 RepID=UPI0034442E0B
MRRIRVFLSSPGDVRDERGIALDVLDRLRFDRQLRGQVDFEAIAWDRPGASAPFLATRTPQASIDEGLRRPADCDIVVVIFWSRLGTPLPHPEYHRADGEPFGSGTEWEFEDALRGAQERGTPEVLLYRRTPMVPVDPDAPDAEEQWRQGRLVRGFFERHRDPRSGAILRGHNVYHTPEEFRTNLESHLKTLALRRIGSPANGGGSVPLPLWPRSPFPGLRPFSPEDAPIYFGRGREADELVTRVEANRFVAVVGASGTGKSSLVGAGLLPRLAAGALPDVPAWLLPEYDPQTSSWNSLRFTPARFAAEAGIGVPTEGWADLMTGRLNTALEGLPAGAEALLFVDQFEELFTAGPDEWITPFASALAEAASSPRIRVVVTIRSDFYHRCLDSPTLAALLENGQFPLSAPEDTLYDMITRPAERAGLGFEEALVGRILSDTGRASGALPLLAYTLDELYRTRGDTGVLGHAAYDRLGGVRGAIGTRAEDTFQRLDALAQASFSQVFRDLVEIGEGGLATRRRADLARIAADAASRRLVEAFTLARLLVRGAEPSSAPVVLVAHEALFTGWTRLSRWIELVREDLHVLRRFRLAAREWDDNGRADAYRWQHERLAPVYEMLTRLDPALDYVEQEFAQHEHERLLPSLGDTELAMYRRQAIVDRLVAIGPAAIPGLMATLNAPEPQARDSAAAALARVGEPAIPALLEASHTPDVDLKLVVLKALRQIDLPKVLPTFRKALRHHDERVYSVAAGALAAMTTPGAAAVLTEAAADLNVDVRWRAVGVLGALGEAAVMPLLSATRDDDTRVRADARAALEAVGPQYVALLLEALRSPQAQKRSAAAETLASVGGPAAPGLAEALGDDDADVRWRAAEVLWACGGRAEVPALLAALVDPHPAVRQAAAGALGKIGAAEATQALVTTLSDAQAEVAEAAAEALGAIGAPAGSALVNVLEHGRDRPVQQLAATALARSGRTGPDRLVSLLFGSAPGVVTLAADALAGLGRIAVPALLTVLRTATERRHQAAVVATLRGIGETAASALLAELDRDPEPAVRRAVAEALDGMVGDEARSGLTRLLYDKDAETSAVAARGLARSSYNYVPVLVRAFLRPRTRAAAAEGLRVAGGDAVPELLGLVRSNSPVRDPAIGLLRVIGTPAAVFGLAELGLLDLDD